jgi:hypothetical protein
MGMFRKNKEVKEDWTYNKALSLSETNKGLIIQAYNCLKENGIMVYSTCTFTKEEEEYLTSEIQRLITLLDMKTSVFNIEVRVATDNKPYIMELTPRGGGNRLCEMLRYATGVDMITAITRAMVGDEPETIEQKPYNGNWAEIILHADKDGEFVELQIDPLLPAEVVEVDLWVNPGDFVHGFEAANDAIGTLVLRFENAENLEKTITSQGEWLKVVTK